MSCMISWRGNSPRWNQGWVTYARLETREGIILGEVVASLAAGGGWDARNEFGWLIHQAPLGTAKVGGGKVRAANCKAITIKKERCCMTPQELLLKAADDFEQGISGWIQGENCNRLGYCLNGKLMECLWYDDEVFATASNTIRAVVGMPSISKWNDIPGRTVQEVIQVCREAAARIA